MNVRRRTRSRRKTKRRIRRRNKKKRRRRKKSRRCVAVKIVSSAANTLKSIDQDCFLQLNTLADTRL